MKRTFQPSNLRLRRKYGFRIRMRNSRNVINNRRRKGRKNIVPSNKVNRHALLTRA